MMDREFDEQAMRPPCRSRQDSARQLIVFHQLEPDSEMADMYDSPSGLA